MTDVPATARLVIIGGGIIGCSTAYHLTRLGWRDIVLLERAKLTSGSTFHAAGLVGQLRTNANITRLLTESVALYERLERETGQATGWKQNGGLRLACTRERMTELKRQATTARSFGLEMHILTPSEARDLWPLMDTLATWRAPRSCRPTARPIRRTLPRLSPRVRARPARPSSRTVRSPGSPPRTGASQGC